MLNEIFVNAVPIIQETDIPPRQEIRVVDIRCTKCNKIVSLRIFRKSFVISPYICSSCIRLGNKNPFYGKHHTTDSKTKIGGALHDYSGNNNPFYGKRHSIETITSLKTNPNCIHVGRENAFYGRHHSELSKQIIAEKNKTFRKNNPEIVLQNNLKRIGKTKEDFEIMLNEYVLPATNRVSISHKHGVDFRTMKYYWIFYKMIDSDSLKKLTKCKQLFSNPSRPEKMLYELLLQEYGVKNVIHCYELEGYYYDIRLFGKLLIEYDGYYWHKILKNKNDAKKTELAKRCGYLLHRVEEGHNREVNLSQTMTDIKTLLQKELLI